MAIEQEVEQSEVFEGAAAPYGIPVISFTPNSFDSKIYLTPGHAPISRWLIATFSWLSRKEGFLFLVQRTPESLYEQGYARYYKVPGDKEVYRIDLTHPSGFEATWFEI